MQTILCYIAEEDSLEEINILQRKIKSQQAFSALFDILELLRGKLKYKENINEHSTKNQNNLATELYYEIRSEIIEIIESKEIMNLIE